MPAPPVGWSMVWAKVGEGREVASAKTLCKRNGPRWPIFGLDCAEREQFDPRFSENRLSRRPSVRRTQAVPQKGVTVHTESYASLPPDSQRTVNTPYANSKSLSPPGDWPSTSLYRSIAPRTWRWRTSSPSASVSTTQRSANILSMNSRASFLLTLTHCQ